MAIAEYRETQLLDPDYIMKRVKGIEENAKEQQIE